MPATLQRQHVAVQTRSVDPKNLTVDVVASTPSVDSYGTIIDQAGWDLEQFKRNPVITWAHDDRGFTASEGLPIANAIPETVRVEGGKLKMRLKFTPEDVHPFGYRVFRMIQEGFLHGLSVGFDPQEDEMGPDANGNTVRIYRKAKLLETAVVTIPSNDDALVQRARQLNREEDVETIRQLAKEVEEMAKKEAPAETPAEQSAPQPEATPAPATEEKAAEVESPLPDQLQEMAQRMTADYVQKCISYFQQKQPVNRAASKVLKKFFQMRALVIPAEEADAWSVMADHLEKMNCHAADMQEAMTALQNRIDAMQKVQDQYAAKNVEDPGDAGNVESPDFHTKQEKSANVEDGGSHDNVEDSGQKKAADATTEDEDAKDGGADEASENDAEDTKEKKSHTPTTPTPEEAPPAARKASVQLPLSVLLTLRNGRKELARKAVAEALRQGVPLDKVADFIAAAERLL
jgi:HK97 family phage prohead protease